MKKTICLMVGIASILTIVGTISYAYFTTQSKEEKQIGGFNTGTMALRFADNDSGFQTEMNFGETVTKKFIIENTGTVEASLSIDWIDLVNTYINGSLTYTLSYSETEDGEYEEIVPKTNVPTSANPISSTLDSEISVPAGATYYYNLNVTLNNLASVDQTSDLSAKFYTHFGAGKLLKYRYHTLRVDPNGGTWETFTNPQEYLLLNDETKDMSDPVRTGYTFDGWEIEGEGSTLLSNVFTMGIEDTTVRARWTVNNYVVTIDGVDREIAFGETVQLEEPTKEGYTFTGWETTGGILEGNNLTISEAKNITVTPTFSINDYKYIVYHNQMNVSGSGYTLVSADTDEGEATYNTTITPKVKTYAGFTSPNEQSLTIKAETVYPPVLNRINYNYDRNQYALTTELNGGSATGIPSSMYYGASITLPTPTKTGYDFTNWTATGGTLDGNDFTMSDADASITANYTPKTFSITFNANGGTTPTASKTVTYDSTYGDLPTPTYSGYNFSGWFTESEGGVEIISSTKVNLSENQVLYARWKKPALKTTLMAKSNDPSITTYNSGNKGEMFAFSHPATEQTEALTDYRYIGSSPNNYIDFNDETWRIIGVFTVETEDGNKEQLIKIIRNEFLGQLPWDAKSDKTFVNDWATASLKTFLNGEYYNTESSFVTTYYTYSGDERALMIPKGLNPVARTQIANVKWYTGGSSEYKNLGGPDYYAFERGTTVYSGHTTNVMAKVGLMYPSDFVYTYANGVDNTCYTNGYNCSKSIAVNGWLFTSDYNQLTLSPFSDCDFFTFRVYAIGGVTNDGSHISSAFPVRPTLYLSSDVAITGGDGSSGNHYKIE